jgi:hypothetical protein
LPMRERIGQPALLRDFLEFLHSILTPCFAMHAVDAAA